MKRLETLIKLKQYSILMLIAAGLTGCAMSSNTAFTAVGEKVEAVGGLDGSKHQLRMYSG